MNKKPDVYEDAEYSQIALEVTCGGCGEARTFTVMLDRKKPQEQIEFVCGTCGTKKQVTVGGKFPAKRKNL